ncbi:MAG: hypothetical protein ABIR35_09495 [Polaromonas sp.]
MFIVQQQDALLRLNAWAEPARRWAAGSAPDDLPSLTAPAHGAAPRDVFIYIAGAD